MDTTLPDIGVPIEVDTDELKNPVITEADKEAFFKSVLTDKPFEDTVQLFGGKFSLTFKGLTVAQNAAVVAQIEKDKEDKIAGSNDAYFIRLSTYRMALGLSAVDGKPVDKKEDTKEPGYVASLAAPYLEWSSAKIAVYLDAFRAFESKLVKMTSEVQRPNFWKASA